MFENSEPKMLRTNFNSRIVSYTSATPPPLGLLADNPRRIYYTHSQPHTQTHGASEGRAGMASKSSKSKKSTQRKLTAILCADVVGYSRLMGGSFWEMAV